MYAPHGLGVALGEIVVDGDDVHAFACQAVEIHRKGRDECLALTGLHLCDPSEMQRRAAHQLDVVVPLTDDPSGSLASDSEGLDQQFVEFLAVGQAILELRSLGLEVCVRQLLKIGFECVDVRDEPGERFDLTAFAST